MPRKKTEKPVIVDILAEQEPTIDFFTPEERLEEDTAQVDTNVAETLEIAPIESEEVLEGDVEDLTELANDPEHFLLNKAGIPVPAKLVQLRESNLSKLVDKLLHAAYLGGDLYPRGFRMGSLPFLCGVLVPEDKVEQFLSGEGKLELTEEDTVLDVTVKGIVTTSFLVNLFKVGKLGAVIVPKRTVSRTGGFSVPLKSLLPLAGTANIRVGVTKPIYTNKQLGAMRADSLKIICKWYNIAFRGASQAKIDINTSQNLIKTT